jgi:hypothetical protein
MKLDRFNQALEPLWVFLHRGHVVRRIVLGVAVWMAIDAYTWVKEYGATEDPNEWLVVAVFGTASALLSASIGFYNSGRAAGPIKGE